MLRLVAVVWGWSLAAVAGVAACSSSRSPGSVVRGFMLSSPSSRVCSLPVGLPPQPRMLSKGGMHVAVVVSWLVSSWGTR